MTAAHLSMAIYVCVHFFFSLKLELQIEFLFERFQHCGGYTHPWGARTEPEWGWGYSDIVTSGCVGCCPPRSPFIVFSGSERLTSSIWCHYVVSTLSKSYWRRPLLIVRLRVRIHQFGEMYFRVCYYRLPSSVADSSAVTTQLSRKFDTSYKWNLFPIKLY